MILSDFHTHTSYSSDSTAPMDDIITAAIRQKLSYLCITEHHDIDFPGLPDMPDMDFQLDLNGFLSEIEEKKRLYQKDLTLLTGIELGMMPSTTGKLSQFVSEHKEQFDYIIGSVHVVDRMDPYYPEYYLKYPGKAGVQAYLQTILNSIQHFMDFDVLGHLDYVVRYLPKGDYSYLPEDFMETIDHILQILIKNHKGIEINTSALFKGGNQPNPHEQIIRRYRELGGEYITFGSDAHIPDAVGYGRELAADILKSAGFTHYTIYQHHQPCLLPI
ncbi:MAG: histidinol-phosphatase HisJ family protein [Lachnospiraceae bacterium]